MASPMFPSSASIVLLSTKHKIPLESSEQRKNTTSTVSLYHTVSHTLQQQSTPCATVQYRGWYVFSSPLNYGPNFHP